jgi:cytochrome c oxidase cbb3-type subunit 3
MNKIYRIKLFKALAALLLLAPASLFAAAPKVSETSNPIAQILLGVVVALAICVVLLASVVLSAAQLHLKKIKETEKGSNSVGKIVALIAFMFISSSLFAAGTDGLATPVDDTIAGLKSASFYGLISAIIAELMILFFLIYNLRFLLKAEKIALEPIIVEQELIAKEPTWQKLWDKANSFRPLKEEAQIDLGHDYDGIRELDNRLPGWWLYGFYLCIFFACIYLWRFHISHTGLSSKEELNTSLDCSVIVLPKWSLLTRILGLYPV